MSTSASISQFMAVLSGGTNPNLLKEVSKNGQNADFQALLQNGQAANTNLLAGISVDGELDPEIMARLQQQMQSGDVSPASAIWQFIRQQASVEGGSNAVVLNLSEKGIPQTVIDDLQKMFGNNDLITILRDPKLNTQLNNALEGFNEEAIDTPRLAGVIDAILGQNKGDINNTINFKVDKNAPANKIIEDLITNGDIKEYTEIGVTFIPVPQQDMKQPVSLTLTQQQLGIGQAPTQAMTPLANSGNPFIKAARDLPSTPGEGNPLMRGLERAAQALAGNNGNGQGAETIADRLAGVTGNNASKAAEFQSSSFSSLMMNAGGDGLVDAEGNFIMPFEAGFKTASQAANPLTMQHSAAQSHPTTQMVAVSLSKMAGKAANGEESQSYRLKLDPPEMGRVDIEMDIIEKTGQLKAIISAEKPESLHLLQRDMHTLLKAMQDAGFENITENDLSFNLSQDFDNMAEKDKNGRGGHKGGDGAPQDGQDEDANLVAIEGEMSVITDPVTGQKQVNMMV